MTSMCEALDLTPNSAETNNFMGVRGYIYSEQGLLGGGGWWIIQYAGIKPQLAAYKANTLITVS